MLQLSQDFFIPQQNNCIKHFSIQTFADICSSESPISFSYIQKDYNLMTYFTISRGTHGYQQHSLYCYAKFIQYI